MINTVDAHTFVHVGASVGGSHGSPLRLTPHAHPHSSSSKTVGDPSLPLSPPLSFQTDPLVLPCLPLPRIALPPLSRLTFPVRWPCIPMRQLQTACPHLLFVRELSPTNRPSQPPPHAPYTPFLLSHYPALSFLEPPCAPSGQHVWLPASRISATGVRTRLRKPASGPLLPPL